MAKAIRAITRIPSTTTSVTRNCVAVTQVDLIKRVQQAAVLRCEDIEANHGGAQSLELAGRGETQAARGTGDNNGFSEQVHECAPVMLKVDADR